LKKYNVLDLVVGLDREQVRVFQGLAVPVLRELRKCIDAGEKKIIIDLEQLTSTLHKRIVTVKANQDVLE